ncbi:helix-turn-helix domain-containing protein [Arthrobacter sp. Sr33]
MTTTPELSDGRGSAQQQWLTPKEICAQLQISEQTFYQGRVKHVGLKAHRIGKHLRISREDFESWLSARLEP